MMTKLEDSIPFIASIEETDQIGILTLDNGKQNQLARADFLDLEELKNWINGYHLKGLILTGRGRHFSSGADINYIKANKDNPAHLLESLKKGKEILSYIEKLPMVTVAAVSGICFGGGLEIALSCQFRIATCNALFCFPESERGIMPGLAGSIRLPQLIGRNKALELILSAKILSAEDALRIGLIDRSVPNKEHICAAKQMIHELADKKTLEQIESIVRSVNNSCQKKQMDAMKEEGELFVKLIKNIW